MEKVTINIEGTSDDVVKALQRLVGSFVEQEGKKVIKEDWTEEDIQRFWRMLTDGAKAALRVVAKQPNGCPRNTLLKELGIKGSQLAGQLSSVGHALRKFPTKPTPFGLNWHTWEYDMIPDLADAIIRLKL
jgi:hypothetical protein